MNTYFGLLDPEKHFLLEKKGSRFLGFAKNLASKEAFKPWLEHLRHEHPKANHLCYAYRILQGEIHRCSDDGEPANSAGIPILKRLEGKSLWNCGLVVVRYFGGIKLGVGGLIRAYGECAEQTILLCGIQNVIARQRMSVEFAYADTAAVEKLLAQFQAEIEEKTFDKGCEFLVTIPKDRVEAFVEILKSTNHQTKEALNHKIWP